MRDYSRRLALGLLVASCVALPSWGAQPAAALPQPPRQEVVEPGPDVEVWLRSCPGAGLRNAKLYAARALGIELMKRSADRNQARSTLDIDRQLLPMLDLLRKRGLPDAELAQLEDAVMGLTELTAQNPVAAQIDSVVRMAEGVAASCQRAAARLGIGGTGVAGNAPQAHMGDLLSLSQRLAMEQLVAAFDARQRAPLAAAVVAQMDERLAALQKVSTDNRGLQNAHALLETQWFFLKRAVQNPAGSGRPPVADIGRTSEIMFEVLEAEMRRLGRSSGA